MWGNPNLVCSTPEKTHGPSRIFASTELLDSNEGRTRSSFVIWGYTQKGDAEFLDGFRSGFSLTSENLDLDLSQNSGT